MAKRHPVEGLKRFVNRLKKQKPTDARRLPESRGGGNGLYARYRNWLVHEWQLWECLLMYPREPCRDREGVFRHFAPAYWVDEETALVTTSIEKWDGWAVCLVWRAGTDYCVRYLSDEELATLSDWNHRMMRADFGFDPRKPPAQVHTRRADRKPR